MAGGPPLVAAVDRAHAGLFCRQWLPTGWRKSLRKAAGDSGVLADQLPDTEANFLDAAIVCAILPADRFKEEARQGEVTRCARLRGRSRPIIRVEAGAAMPQRVVHGRQP